MSLRYPPEVDAAIRAMYSAGMGPEAARAALKAGSAAEGLDPCDMARSSFYARWAKLKQEGPPVSELEPDQEPADAAAAIRRRALETAHREERKLDRLSRESDTPLSAAHLTALDRLLKTVSQVEHQDRRRGELASSSNAAHRGSAAASGTPRSPLLAALARAEAGAKREPVPDDHSSLDTGEGDTVDQEGSASVGTNHAVSVAGRPVPGRPA